MTHALSAATPQLSATVSASAGTGKTWLLVTRLVRLLIDGARADSILAITFTRKAAAEMQSRLGERLQQLARAEDMELQRLLQEMGADSDSATRARARNLYETILNAPYPVKTTTFHAFCQELLRRFPLEADVPPGFELLEKTGELEQLAWQALYSEATTRPDSAVASALEALFDHCGSLASTQQALNSFLAHRSDWWAFTRDARDPVAWASQRLRQQLNIDPAHDPRADFFSNTRQADLQEFAALLARHPGKNNDRDAASIAIALDAELPLEQRFTSAASAFTTENGDTPKKREESKIQLKNMGAAGQLRFLELHAALSESIITVTGQMKAHATWRTTRAWYRVGARLLEHYQALKLETRSLDFADLEWQTYRLLHQSGNAHWVQYKLDQRIDHLLIDEFQDTNPTQWQLVLPLLQELAAGVDERTRSVFLVGDSKQSIYRFRRAEPQLFAAAQQWLQQHLDAADTPLAVSWRSAPAVMDAVNAIFGDGVLGQRIRTFTQHSTHRQHLWGKVELLPLIEIEEPGTATEDRGLRNPLSHPRPENEDTRHYREGQAIARQIESLIAAHTPVNDTHPLRYSDIMILVRARTQVQHVERALLDAGIPYEGANRGTLLNALEVRDMVALLETLIAPFNNLALATVLRSPLFACDEQMLLHLSRGAGTWFEKLMAIVPGQSTPAALLSARTLLARWQPLAGHIPVHDLLDRIYSEGDVYQRYQAASPLHLQHRVRANLERFIELALEIDSGRYPSIGHFIARLESLRQDSTQAPDEVAATHEDRVRIMTIHASKGLEAAVVFLADATHTQRDKSTHKALVDWPPARSRPEHFLLVGPQDSRDPLSKSLIEQQQAAEQREDANLLYVALTRAKQLLYISGSHPKRGEDLGWYGLIHERLSANFPPSADGTIRIESGNYPATSAAPMRPASAPSIYPTLDPQVLRSPPWQRRTREIAPSRSDVFAVPDLHAPDDDGRIRGIAIHRMLQWLCEGGDESQLLSQIASELDRELTDPDLTAWTEEALRVFRHASLRPVFDPLQYQSAYNEVAVQYRISGQTVHGIIDRVVLPDAGSVLVIDYKTHRVQTSEQQQLLAELCRAQLEQYCDGVRRLWPERQVRSAILLTHSAQLLTI